MTGKILKNSLIAASILVLIGAISFILIDFKRNITSLLFEMNLQSISEVQELYAKSLKNKINDEFRLLEVQSSYFLDIDVKSTDEVRKHFNGGIKTGDFRKMAIINRNGVAVDSNGKLLPNMKNKNYFMDAISRHERQVSNGIELDESLNPTLTFAFPFKAKGDEPAIMAGILSYDALKQIFSIPIFSGKAYVYLISNDGNIIFLNKEKNKSIYNVDFYAYVRKNSGQENKSMEILKEDIAKHRSGHIMVEGIESQKLFTYMPLKINDWYLISVIPYSYITDQQKNIEFLVYILLFGIAAAIVIFATVLYGLNRRKIKIEKDNQRLTIANNQAQTLIFEYDAVKHKIDFSGDTVFILGSEKKNYSLEYIQNECFSRIHPEDQNILAYLHETVENQKSNFSAEFRYKSFANRFFWVKMTGSSIIDESGKMSKFIGSISNVNSQVLHEQELKNMAERDNLSDLLNKNAMEKKVQDYFMNAGKNKQSALFIVDLDNFKEVNDKLGHMTGDFAIKDAAKKLSLIFSDKDYLSRFGGDEFCVLMRFNENITAKKAHSIITAKAEDMVAMLRETYFNDAQSVVVTASIGVAVYPAHGTSYDELFSKADESLYNVKHHKKNGYRIWQEKK